MMRPLKAFEVDINGTPFDYRIGGDVNLETVNKHFSSSYEIKKIWIGGRHIVGVLSKGRESFFLKLSTSKGISELTKNEYAWNEVFNSQIPPNSPFAVPVNVEHGYVTRDLYFFVTREFKGVPLMARPTPDVLSNECIRSLTDIVDFSETISNLQLEDSTDHRSVFLSKTRAWYEAIPEHIRHTHRIIDLLTVVETGVETLGSRPRHGDFTPWHLFRLDNGKLGLIDGEHYLRGGVEYYDIVYFLQRIYTIVKSPRTAQRLLRMLLERGYDKEKLQVVLAARAIGGYLDAVLANATDVSSEKSFHEWLLSL